MGDKKIDDIISMIDQLMPQDGDHMNAIVDDDGTVNTKETFSKIVTRMNSPDCVAGDLAYGVPTFFEGPDTADDPDSDVGEQGGFLLWQT